MSKQYRSLHKQTLKQNISYCRPTLDLNSVAASDPALKVMTDFRIISAITTRAGTSITDCNEHMIANKVRLLLVTDDKNIVRGILTASDILGEKPMLFMQKVGGTHEEIQAMDIMTPFAELEMLTLDDVENAKVGDIIETLIKGGRYHTLVTCDSENSDDIKICGMFSVTQIGKQVGAPIVPADIAKTFSELGKVIAS